MGASPVPVSTAAPGSRPQPQGEIPAAERGVKSLYGGSKRAGCDCSLVKFTTKEPSRSCHGEGHTWRSRMRTVRQVLPGYGKLHARKACVGTWESRLAGHVGKDRTDKPMVKRDGGKRQSEGAVVVPIGAQNNAPGAKDPRFDHASEEGKH